MHVDAEALFAHLEDWLSQELAALEGAPGIDEAVRREALTECRTQLYKAREARSLEILRSRGRRPKRSGVQARVDDEAIAKHRAAKCASSDVEQITLPPGFRAPGRPSSFPDDE